MEITWKALAVICPLVFFGGFVDSVAGGGGIITLPAYLLVGFPAHLAAGTNKLVASSGALVSSGKYIKNGNVDFKVALFSMAGALAGGALGSRLALLAPEQTLKMIILVALPLVAAFLLIKKDFGKAPRRLIHAPPAQAAVSLGIGLVMGCYDGLVGPGAGTFMLIAFTGLLGTDLLTSAACARVSNLASNVAALVVFMLNGQVAYAVFLPAMLCSVAGNWAGARFAIRGGSGNVRKIMLLVLALLFLKLAADLLL